jgi:myosin heavy subunit
MEQQQENKSSKGVLIILILSLLGNGILGYKFFTTNQEKQVVTIEKEKTAAELDSIIDIRVALESELTNTKADLDKFKGYSAELDSLLAGAKEQLAQREKRIASLSKDSKKLKELQGELEDLKKMRDTLLEQVDKLVQENNLLKKENQEFQATISDLNVVKSTLEKKVESGSVLAANNVLMLGYKEKGSGKKAPTVIAKKTDLVDVCFDLAQNRIAPTGNKEVYLRIISPEGSTLAVQSLGSGTFKEKESGQDNLFTAKKTISYDGSTKNHCISWKPNMPFAPGKYKAEVYVDGYLAGVGGVILK